MTEIWRLEDVDSLSYNELRKAAKSFNVKTNKKAVKLRAELKKILRIKLEAENQVPNEEEEAFSHAESYTSTTNKTTLLEQSLDPACKDLSTLEHCATSSRKTTPSRTSSERHALNVTYELEEPVFVGKTCEVDAAAMPLEHSCQDVQKFSNCSGDVQCKNPGEVSQLLPPSQTVHRAPKDVTKSSVRPVPDFRRIHEAAASKLESITHYVNRRRPPFASPNYRSTVQEKASSLRVNTGTSAAIPLKDVSNHHTESIGSNAGITANSKLTHSSSLIHPPIARPHRLSTSSRDSLKKAACQIPQDSAFARRKAYDMQRSLLRTSLKRTSAGGLNNDNRDVANSSSWDSNFTARKRDPLVRSLSLHVEKQKKRTAMEHQRIRRDAQLIAADLRRGLC